MVEWFIRVFHTSLVLIAFYTLLYGSGGVLWYHIGGPCVFPSVHQGPGLGLLMGKFHQFLTIISP